MVTLIAALGRQSCICEFENSLVYRSFCIDSQTNLSQYLKTKTKNNIKKSKTKQNKQQRRSGRGKTERPKAIQSVFGKIKLSSSMVKSGSKIWFVTDA